MGKRAKAKAPPKKKQKTVPKVFNCPFCNHASSCECRMDRDNEVGKIECRICKENFKVAINNLSDPIDVYSAWIDACEEVNEG